MRSPKGRLELTWMGKDMALIPTAHGKYDYEWADPADPRACEIKRIEVVDTVGEQAGPNGAEENLLIIGDSGDALRSLSTVPEWAAKYRGKVKLVYIDPPFNTEQTFEHYADQLEHSIWLTMMRDRIRELRPLLSADGSIWVHLDDAEVHRMRVVLDEELGPENFIAAVVWRASDNSNNDAKQFSEDHNTILGYSVSPNWRTNRLPADAEKVSHYSNPDRDPLGPWFDGNPLNSPNPRENLRFTVTSPTGHPIPPPPNGWRWSRETLQAKIDSGEIRFTTDGKGLRRRTYLRDHAGLPPSTLWISLEATGHTRQAKSELKALFPGVPTAELFATPKPEKLMQQLIALTTNEGDLVLDCFGGSGTTAAVAHKMNRRWLTVELLDRNVERFIVPRLVKVVEGDPGGISSAIRRVGVADLPAGISPHDAQRFTALLSKLTDGDDLLIDVVSEATRIARSLASMADGPLTVDESRTLVALLRKVSAQAGARLEVDVMPQVRSQLREKAKTRNETSVLWNGGGGFTVARIGPSMYEVDDDGEVYLSAAATNGAWSKAVAGQLDETTVRTVVEHLREKEKAVVVGKGVLPEAEALLAELSPGSRIRKAPGDLFGKATVR
jgi:adenine-specific DNA-methyltransferase